MQGRVCGLEKGIVGDAVYPENTNAQHPRMERLARPSAVFSHTRESPGSSQTAVTYLGWLPNHLKGKRHNPEEARRIGISRREL